MHMMICLECGQWTREKGLPCGTSTVHNDCVTPKSPSKVRLGIDAVAPERFRLYRGY